MKKSTLHNFPEFDGLVPWDNILPANFIFCPKGTDRHVQPRESADS